MRRLKDSMSASEKILFVEDLSNSISSDESLVAVPQSHIDELDSRLKKYEFLCRKAFIH